MTDILYFEDLVPGRRFESDRLVISEADIIAFATMFDPQPFHKDPAAARGSLFQGLAASGWHTAALSMRLIVTSRMKLAGGLIGRDGEIVWPRPTRPGDELRVVSEVLTARASASRPAIGWVRMRNETLNQNDEVVQMFTPNIPVPRRAGG